MRNYCALVFMILISLVSSQAYSASQNSAEDLFFQANQAYKDGNYPEAVQLYSELTGTGHTTGHLFYNLGNACFRAGDPGRAILNYKRAELFIPRDADLRFNLSYARDRTGDATEEPELLFDFVFFWVDSLSLDELFYAFALVNLVFFVMLTVRIFTKREWTYYVVVVCVIVWLIAGLSFGTRYVQIATDSRVVILADELNVLAGPDPHDTVLFRLHAGTVLERERSEGGWSLIRISDEKRGWVESHAIGSIKIP